MCSDPEFFGPEFSAVAYTGDSAFSSVNTAWMSPATWPRAFLTGGAR
jgi:hypothetical protein